ncbi:hypothetical protein ACFSQT_35715 [Mesorhizobium calcicola]|uniref:Uncharacterized protein n=1 Tax=Mesorhizobium calcicola TaxID=1300310 RepID=A0ABW4WRL9_9HYPH
MDRKKVRKEPGEQVGKDDDVCSRRRKRIKTKIEKAAEREDIEMKEEN